MSRSALLILLLSGSVISSGQNIELTFSGKGAASNVETVTAANIRTKHSITLPGNETLVLALDLGIPLIAQPAGTLVVYPNPLTGTAALKLVVQKPQMAEVKIRDLNGKVVSQISLLVRPGGNEFALTLSTAGIYVVSVVSEQGIASCKVICTRTTGSGNSLKYIGSASENDINSTKSGLASTQTGYSLDFKMGDIIHFDCRSGIYSTVISDSPVLSKKYEVEFDACTDANAKNYKIVKIGDQIWMAENLAYLPSVSPVSTVSDTGPEYYVYDYQGSSVPEAMATSNYSIYGVLYNWVAAKTTCPAGWHLPTDAEWQVLEKFEGMSASEADTIGWRYTGLVGGKLKEADTLHWVSPNANANNSSGLTVLPGGHAEQGGFFNLGFESNFWTSTGYDSSTAWIRLHYYYDDGVDRYFYPKSQGFSVRCVMDGH